VPHPQHGACADRSLRPRGVTVIKNGECNGAISLVHDTVHAFRVRISSTWAAVKPPCIWMLGSNLSLQAGLRANQLSRGLFT
jgi:hypothetical protein